MRIFDLHILRIMSVITPTVVILALLIRRRSFRTPWEAAPTVLVITASSSVFMTSQWASMWLNGYLYSLTGLWNLEDLIGHILLVIAAATAVYAFLGNFADDDVIRDIFTRNVALPITVVIPSLVAFFVWGCGGHTYQRWFDRLEGRWQLETYWAILTATIICLLGFATRLLLILRSDGRTIAIDLYLTAIFVTFAALGINGFQVLTNAEIHVWARFCAYLSAIMWSVAAATSWTVKSRRRGRIPNPPPHDLSRAADHT